MTIAPPSNRTPHHDVAPTDPGGRLAALLGASASGQSGLIDGATEAARKAGQAEPYRRFLDALGVAVYTTDAQGRITFFNKASVAFWGRRPRLGEEWCGSWRLFWPDGTAMKHDECPMAVTLREDREVRGAEAIAERPDGTRVSFVPYPTPLHDASGALIGAVNVLVDVTERRRAEDALRETADALAASNAVKDEFLGLVSHELRTPVTTIFGNAQLLVERRDRLAPDVATGMIDDIAGDADRLLGIIENLLLLTSLEAGAMPDLEPQVLPHVVRGSVEAFRRRHPGRTVRLSGGRLHSIVQADRTYLEILVGNLLANADKYSPPETPIEVNVRAVGGEVRVSVLDRGIGIGRDEADDVFSPFYRGREARRAANGIGIGLAVCRLVAETQGGRVWARPRPRGGADVGFAIPLSPELVPAD